MEHQRCFKCDETIDEIEVNNVIIKDEPGDILEVEPTFDHEENEGKIMVTSGKRLRTPMQCSRCNEWFNSKDADLGKI